MKWVVLIVLAGAGVAFLLLRDTETLHAPAARTADTPAVADPTPPPSNYQNIVAPEDVKSAGVLKLPMFDDEKNNHAGRPAAYNLRRNGDRLEREYAVERERRLKIAVGLVNYLGPQLDLGPEQARGMLRLLMERGDSSRIAAYEDLFGVANKHQKHARIDAADHKFTAALRELLKKEQFAQFERIEDAGADENGRDLGFGAVFGRGGGKERYQEEVPAGAR